MTSRTILLFLHLRCRGGPSDLQFRLGLAQLPDLHHLLGLVRAELWAELQRERLHLGLMHHRDLNDRGKFDLLLQLVDLKLRAQTLGLDLRAAMLPVKRMPREHEHLGEHGSPVCESAQPCRLRPSPRRPPAPVPTIPAWAPCLRPLTRSTALQGFIQLVALT